VVPRDRHAELLSALALTAASIERFATEIRHLARTEVREVQEPFRRGQKGSSAMPHKRNPIVAERLCGLARVVRAAAAVGLENVALWHERDISHSSAERVVIPDAFLAVDYMLDRFAWLVEGLLVNADRMRRNLDASHGLVFSQRVLLALVASGLERDDAYRLVQRTHCARGTRSATSVSWWPRTRRSRAGSTRPRSPTPSTWRKPCVTWMCSSSASALSRRTRRTRLSRQPAENGHLVYAAAGDGTATAVKDPGLVPRALIGDDMSARARGRRPARRSRRER
jgi:hypothetical protein